MKNLLAITFFVLSGQCWVTDGQQAINLANTFAISQRGPDVHMDGSYYNTSMEMKLVPFLKAMQEQCGTAQAESTP